MYEPHERLLDNWHRNAVDISPEMHAIIKDTSGTHALHSLQVKTYEKIKNKKQKRPRNIDGDKNL